jgi:hypothetical protein
MRWQQKLPNEVSSGGENWRARRSKVGALGAGHPHTAYAAHALACVLALESKRNEAVSNLRYAVDHALLAETRHCLDADTI